MLQQLMYALPELALLAGIANLLWLRVISTDSAKIYSHIARFWVLISLFLSIIFYERQWNNNLINNAYTLLFIIWIDVSAYVMLALSSTWFSSQNITGCKYNSLILASGICFNLLLAANNINIIFCTLVFLLFINRSLIKISYDKKSEVKTKYYTIISLVMLVIFLFSYAYLYIVTAGKTEFSVLTLYLEQHKMILPLFCCALGLITLFLYALGIAPFHAVIEEKVSNSILPVAHYFAIIVPIVMWGMIIKINHIIFPAYSHILSSVYVIFAILSVIIGAIGANVRTNLNQIYAYSSMYHFGIVLLLLSIAQEQAEFAAFIYLLVYIIGLNGLYASFYNLKSHGEYLNSVSSLAGLAQTRPHTTYALLISIFSLKGFPPLAGFLGQFNSIYQLVNMKMYICLIIICLCFLLLAK
ncbi:MAG: hypothetical protein J6W96_03305, partial [Alphaproteobacteria bacterium]|nr:hypothetical protein [Alphaproteobacteria bacterium]